jgi:hypothetical protein
MELLFGSGICIALLLLVGRQAATWDLRCIKKATESDVYSHTYLAARNLLSRSLIIENRRLFETAAKCFTVALEVLFVPFPF